MENVNTLLAERLKKKENLSKKMTTLASKVSSGDLSSFAGVFKIIPLSKHETSSIEELLKQYQGKIEETGRDLEALIAITSEVKAINSQAVLLHGERIKKAQEILKNYKDGAFSSWLILTYGNRQTPYNFLQYYEFTQSLKSHIREKINELPRQAVYTLATREGDLKVKEELIASYSGEPKELILEKIRNTFPLSLNDKRRANLADQIVQQLEKLQERLSIHNTRFSSLERKKITELLLSIKNLLH